MTAQHYPRGTTEASHFCTRCNRFTRHRIDFPASGKGGGRVGPCLEHKPQELTKAQLARRLKQARGCQQASLFGDKP